MVSLELVRVDLSFHRVEELGPRVGFELGHELARLRGAALRAWVVRSLFAQLVEDLEDVGALDAFVIVQGHGKRLRPFSGIRLRRWGLGKNNEEHSLHPAARVRYPEALCTANMYQPRCLVKPICWEEIPFFTLSN